MEHIEQQAKPAPPPEANELMPAIVAQIQEQYVIRRQYHQAEKRLINQVGAVERRTKSRAAALAKAGEPARAQWAEMSAQIVTAGLSEARTELALKRKAAEKVLANLARRLPVWPWVSDVKGFGALGLAIIVGEAGDLSAYPRKGHLWKRMGLAVINGAAQGRKRGDAALGQGYSPTRRSAMWTLGDSMIKCGAHYRMLYLARKEYEREHCPDGTSPMHIHRRAQRYMEKMMLRDLWTAWQKHSGVRSTGAPAQTPACPPRPGTAPPA